MERMAVSLTNPQKKFLRGLAHGIQANIHVGKLGLTPSFYRSLEESLTCHELLKLKFTNLKDERRKLSATIETVTGAQLVSLVGHTAVYYRPSPDVEKRKLELPKPKRKKPNSIGV